MATVSNTRILGDRLGLVIDGVNYWSDVAEYSLAPSDSDKDFLTFADAAGGSTSNWTLSGKAIQSFDTTSFWRKVWEMSGQTVEYVLAPFGNATASATQPHFTGSVKIGVKPSIGTSAGETKGATFDFSWDCTGEPTLAESTSTLPA